MQSTAEYIRERVTTRDVVPGFTPCWEWNLAKHRDGYGLCFLKGYRGFAHRAAYRAFGGEIPEGAQLDHLCRNKPCVNPDHLEPVTAAVNQQRAKSHATGRDYAIYQRAQDNLWCATLTLPPVDGKRRRKTFVAKTEDAAVAKLEAFRAA